MESIEASEQLRIANRQLVMCLKIAETRAKKSIEKVDITIAVLQEAIRSKTIRWHAIALSTLPFHDLFDLVRLSQVYHFKLPHRCNHQF